MSKQSTVIFKLTQAEHQKLKVISAMAGKSMTQMIKDYINSFTYSDVCDVRELED